MLDQQLSQKLAGKGMGLADMIVKQLDKKFVDPAALKDGQSGTTGQHRHPADAPSRRTARPATARAAPALRRAEGLRTGALVPMRRRPSRPRRRARPQFILGQAALESGWGKRDIKHADGSTSHNLFGIKAGGNWKGATVDATTTEYVGGVAPASPWKKFRAYSSYAESFSDYANLLQKQLALRAATLQSGTDAAKFATSLQQAGYATDPNYAKKADRRNPADPAGGGMNKGHAS